MRDPMVIASASASNTVRKDLKSLSGGYVEARLLTYGEKLARRAMVSGMKIEMQDRKRKKSDDKMSGEMNLVNEAATLFDFAKCIVQSNLEIADAVGEPNEDGSPPAHPCDFTNPSDVKKLDPRVGEEIDTWLSELNNFDEDEEGED
jgi:hypothetical protein